MEFEQENSIGEQMEKTGSNSRWSHGWRTISIATIVAAPRVTTPHVRVYTYSNIVHIVPVRTTISVCSTAVRVVQINKYIYML